MNYRAPLLCLLLLAAVRTLPDAAAQSLEASLKPVLEAHRGQVSMAVKHLSNGEQFAYRATEPMPTASLIKLPVMIEAYRQAAAGVIDLDAMLTLREEDKVPGSGILTPHFSPGLQLRLRDAVRLMIAHSDNTATNLVLDQIGLESTSKTMEQLGFANTKIHAKVFRQDTSIFPERSRQFGLGSTTAAEMVALLERLQQGEFGEPATGEMMQHLLHCDDTSRIPRFLPSGVKVAHKTGSVTRVRTDAGIILSDTGPIALCVLTSENEDTRWVDDNDANRLCAQVAKIVFDHFQPTTISPDGTRPTLGIGAHGQLVEDLQRTLNARLEPSPELSVDGDFGPATEAAVRRFQEANQLKNSGSVDTPTWQALGPLITSDPPVPAPDIVNHEQLPRSPIDTLDGPPHVTCQAWAIADGKTGEMLWSHNADQARDFASTTKIMTAYLVLKLAAGDPSVLEETVQMSARADQTPGSTAGIRTGESLSVAELLYGLMLPSGNDASVALAEHFGGRFEPAETDSDPQDPLRRFVAEMNRVATDLGMTQTSFENPHGITSKNHRSSPRDLLMLAHAAIQLPRFSDYVNTRQRGCALQGPGGYQRHVVWKNTNQLLSIDGYQGIKTGTTSAAGACLVSHGSRGDEALLVVVLGATSGNARYVDTRNLFRCAWRERRHAQ